MKNKIRVVFRDSAETLEARGRLGVNRDQPLFTVTEHLPNGDTRQILIPMSNVHFVEETVPRRSDT